MMSNEVMTLNDVLAATAEGIAVGFSNATPINTVRIDSREVGPGDVFVALKGTATDGHLYVKSAFEKGAAAAIVSAEVGSDVPREAVLIRVPDTLKALHALAAYWRKRFAVKVVAVTGSIGKTTTKELIAQVLARKYETLKSEGNLNSETGLPLSVFKLQPQHKRAVFEMGMYAPGEIAALCRIVQPDIGVITKVEPVHMERLGSIENIANAKAELVQSLSIDGVAVLNADDERVRNMMALNRGRSFMYGTTSQADLWASDIEGHGLDGISLTLHHKRETFRARVPLLGAHSAYTVLRAASVGLVDGMSWEDIIAALREPSTQLRLVALQGPFNSVVLDDRYNASGESTLAALNLLATLEGGPRVAVLGEMYELGDLEEQQHRMVGCRAALVAQYIITLGPKAKWIAEEALACGANVGTVFHFDTHAEVLDGLRRLVTRKCVVLFKGSRGLEMEKIVNEFVVRGEA